MLRAELAQLSAVKSALGELAPYTDLECLLNYPEVSYEQRWLYDIGTVLFGDDWQAFDAAKEKLALLSLDREEQLLASGDLGFDPYEFE